ncbi:DUF2637 domain-containing protein [Micromonospora sp. RL09-050-HVF-A]|uniref:DUF2637 domain-containing protein n=1 Tax=Micromonospora sp. RL09-050-HVF-A TaxID=1703433 RepID=UPI001C5F03BA|nr:DUF2637 domain-containing protein [Micromonospora sp. RL09-050-HVF-A]MBW4705165.1 DUF2637 domain-containing protein [Micromonospora sp. RL09-050-HVF-A]
MLAIGGAAGAASFTHVHNVAAAHGQPGWLAWADAIVLELMSIASGLELRRRKRAQVSTVFPATVLACAVTLSLAAQVVEAEPSPIGWTAAAVPALGFLVMVKIALGYTNTPPKPTPAGTNPSTARPADPSIATASQLAADRNEDRSTPTADRRLPARTVHHPTNDHPQAGPDHSQTGASVRRHRPSRRGPSTHPTDTEVLLPIARRTQENLAVEGRPLTRAALATALRATGHTVSNTRASQLLKILKADQPPTAPTADRQTRQPADHSPPYPAPEPATPTTSRTSAPLPPQSGDPTP